MYVVCVVAFIRMYNKYLPCKQAVNTDKTAVPMRIHWGEPRLSTLHFGHCPPTAYCILELVNMSDCILELE